MPNKIFPHRLPKSLNGRFAFLGWPLGIFRERVAAMRENGPLSDRAGKTCYPIRAVRYWWVLCALIDEVRNKKRRIRIADVGCSKGFLKDFTGDALEAEWVGLDMNIDDHALGASGYQETHECDFDRPLPLPAGSVDVVVFLHVIEHLPRPSFTMRELSRILRPGGLLLAGSPVAPGPAAWLRERQLRSRLRKGTAQPGGHINSMNCGRWRTLVKQAGLDLRMLTGTFLARCSGSPLENKTWWLRLNQLWGALFPSLGGETYLSARKPEAVRFPVPDGAPARVFTQWKRRKGLAFVLVIFAVFWSFVFDAPWSLKCPVAAVVARHQDGNDVFYTVKHPAMKHAVKERVVADVHNPQDIAQTYEMDRKNGKDPNYFIPLDLLPSFSHITTGLELNVVENVEVEAVKFALLNSEGRD